MIGFFERYINHQDDIVRDIGTNGLSLPSVLELKNCEKVCMLIGYTSIPFDGAVHLTDLRLATFDTDSGKTLQVVEIDDDFKESSLYDDYKAKAGTQTDVSIDDFQNAFNAYISKVDYSDDNKLISFYYANEQPKVLSISMSINPAFFKYISE